MKPFEELQRRPGYRVLTVDEAAQYVITPLNPLTPTPGNPSVRLGHRPPCAYLGTAILGAYRDCKTCGGHVRLKVFGCTYPGHAARPTTTETECRACGDYATERAKVAKP